MQTKDILGPFTHKSLAISSATKKLHEGRTNGESVIVVVETFGREEKINLFYWPHAKCMYDNKLSISERGDLKKKLAHVL